MSSYDPRQHQQRLTAPQQQYEFPPPGQSRPPQQGYWPQQPPPQQPKHRRSHGVLITVLVLVAILAAGGAAWALGGHHMPGQAAAKPPSCHQQYLNWKSSMAGDKAALNTDLTALQTASTSDDIPQMDAALKQLGTDVTTIQGSPIPSCADPAGYWPQVLRDLKAASDNATSQPGMSGILAASGPVQLVKPLEGKLKTELARTTQVK